MNEPNNGALSDPSHHRYGEHLSKKEVDELVAPHPESVDSVHRWLATHGFEKRHLTISSAGDWVKLVLPISRAEQMLDTVGRLLLRISSNRSSPWYDRNIMSGNTETLV